jgi:stringent starvation protein B
MFCFTGFRRTTSTFTDEAVMETDLLTKKDVALAMLKGENASLFLHLDARRKGVAVPMEFWGQHELVLQIGWNLPTPIPDLEITDWGITGTLSFHRQPFRCEIPWSSVYILYGDDRKGIVWNEDLPPELARVNDYSLN